MNFFEEAALRLKQQLKVTEDKAVAKALGITSNAWTMRKRRGSFPETELYALAAKRPDLELDVGYVMTGKTKQQLAAAMRADFGPWLKRRRGEMSTKNFAAQLGLTEADLDALESQKRNPSSTELQRIVACIGADGLGEGDQHTITLELDGLEKVLIQNYRNSSPEAQEAMQILAAFHAQYAVRMAERTIPAPGSREE